MKRLMWSLVGVSVILAIVAGRVAGEAKPDTRAMEKKVDQVLANQQLILQKLDAMMEELHIVKIRATHS